MAASLAAAAARLSGMRPQSGAAWICVGDKYSAAAIKRAATASGVSTLSVPLSMQPNKTVLDGQFCNSAGSSLGSLKLKGQLVDTGALYRQS